ncbi:ShlB/FhaC/HecB family hemolysin secretion/activation protein [Massilia sp. Mn16-1_5]|uniref:ShlB/FhaC/HecB family hemolysin secretion/activation protein n=1 Tax=Massilia sp. Mn16-1_5 TaxID=2079199 RepID=UPI00109E4A15|nr:ShlB/FhaC/HecB family hemolysin secretion/activation protein [Massilia sp. Mn16-1_5]THC44209.1 ShlB/FhaC/HecB family hemolysin secretion/activation protein [Massilia sp. Mn16-1_5]
MNTSFSLVPAALLVLLAYPACAQQLPDAGRLLQENAVPPLQAPRPAPGVSVQSPAAAPAPGGVQVSLRQVTIDGNSAIGTPALLATLGDVGGKTFDFAGLEKLAARITAHYQAAGYPFARAVLPQQDLSGGQLRIRVIEGRYGKIAAGGKPELAQAAQPFLDHLSSGAPIESGQLERVTLILDDQPGIKTRPTIRPGQDFGSGDLLVDVQREQAQTGEVALDNHGNRHTGRTRARAGVEWNSPFTFGDQLSVQALVTNEKMWFGALGYSLPIGSSGLRGRAGLTHSYYTLAGDFRALDATGTADIASAGLSYPIVRSQRRNLSVSSQLEHKRLNDRQGALDAEVDKSSLVAGLALNFDARDEFIRTGITFGALRWSLGRLHLDDTLSIADQASARSAGRFRKINLDLARIQALSEHVDLYGRLSRQWASKNLDSSEKFGLGGSHGVRAWPSGEGFGDAGSIVQVELRYTMEEFAPFIFHDAGKVTVNRSPWTADVNRRSLSGSGVGLRYHHGQWYANLAAAWRGRGGAVQSDAHAGSPMVLADVQYRF